jgi:TetR/AcrR family transcriptional regulator, cholesterol catabolism regulator
MNPQQERIIEGARDLFFRHGMKSITMDDIASHLGMSKKTIYQFYEDKEGLILALTSLELGCQEKEMLETRKHSENAIDEIMQVMALMGRMMNKISPNVFYDMQKYYQDAWKRFKEFKSRQMIGFVEENLRRGMKQELYRKDLQIKILARLRIEEVELGYNPYIYPPDQFNISDVQISLLDHFLHGIVTIKGHRLINKYKQINEED